MSYYLEQYPNVGVPQYGWPRNRVSGVIGVHTTESGVYLDGADPGAENTAGYLTRRTNHGSYHIMADWDTIIPLVRPTFAAWADTTNNAHALSVSGAMNAARWRDLSPGRAARIVRNMGIAAAMLVRDAIAHGVLDEIVPARRITAQQAIDGSAKGFYGHGETNPGTRYDPGTNFDWDLFLSTYAAAVGGNITYQSITSEKGFPVALTSEEEEAFKRVTFTKQGQEERARVDADVLLSSTVPMHDGGNPTVAELFAAFNTRLNELKALDVDLRGEADLERARNAALQATLNAVLESRPDVNTESVLARIDEHMANFTAGYKLAIVKEETE